MPEISIDEQKNGSRTRTWTVMRDVEVDKLTINMTKRKEKKEGTVRMPKLDRAKARQGREKRLSDGEASLERLPTLT